MAAVAGTPAPNPQLGCAMIWGCPAGTPVVVIHVVEFVLGIGDAWFDSAAVVGTEGPDFVVGRGARLRCGACAPVCVLDVVIATETTLHVDLFVLTGLSVRCRRIDRSGEGGEGRGEGEPRWDRHWHQDRC